MIRTTLTPFAPIVLAIFWAHAAGSAHADTTLLFETSSGTWLSPTHFATYGDRVSATVQNGFRYGGAADTSNILCTFGPSTSAWSSLYGDLTNVIYTGAADGVLRITLSADPGFLAVLHSFDLAGWPETDYTLRSVKIFGSAGEGLFAAANVYVQGDTTGPRHTTMSFAPIVSRVIDIQVDASNLPAPWYAENLGLDNLRFGQAAVPEPGTLSMLVVALLGAWVARGRRRRWPGVALGPPTARPANGPDGYRSNA